MNSSFSEVRNKVHKELETLLIGPSGGQEEVVKGRLSLRYLAGILYPVGSTRGQIQQETTNIADGDGGEEFSADLGNPLSLANEMLPSSAAITICVKRSDDIYVTVGGARYYEVDKSKWKRRPLNKEEVEWKRRPLNKEEVALPGKPTFSENVLSGAAILSVTRRVASFDQTKELVTVAITNAAKVGTSPNTENKDNIQNRIYQLSLSCRSGSGIQAYIGTSQSVNGLENQVLALQYKDSPVYGVGHGASVDWLETTSGVAEEVFLTYAPSALVNKPIFDSLQLTTGDVFEDIEILSLSELASPQSTQKNIADRLAEFTKFYGQWIETQRAEIIPKELNNAANYLIDGMDRCRRRMKQGIDLLRTDSSCWNAFQLDNSAMLIQMDQNIRVNQLREICGKTDSDWPIPASEGVNNLDNEVPFQLTAKWRPFQLAFFLMTFADLEDPEGKDSELVDLIWFSTGGGKTEAYLLLAAYELIRRRFRYERTEVGFGTGVITRYTLRFLTADQFSRTASLICALEKLRRKDVAFLGEEPFSLGLYAGGAVSYNKLKSAEESLQRLKENPNESHLFQIEYCPNCATAIFPKSLSFNAHGEPDYSDYGIKSIGKKVEVYCPNVHCLFSDGDGIPIRTVDDDVFNYPPSFLLGTVDKFANFAFGSREGNLFKGVDGQQAPPSLIIQDELHLISGPLGTISAIYESAFDSLIRHQNRQIGLGDYGAKYIASSATVRDAETQIFRLMGRPSAIFPPPGIKASDSFFSVDDDNPDTARLYLGVMSQGINSTTSAHWTAAAILGSVRIVAEREEYSAKEMDFLWSLVCYCNSKRELGLLNASTNDEILARMRVYADIEGFDPELVEDLLKEEVSSQGVKSISETRGSLLIPLADSGRTSVRDFIPATNMISVGVDINRLGAMMINGQPKTTAEYIQASSRVGRNPDGNGPGLVVTLYSPAKPRDRSHYEHFKGYHQSLYRLVEPTSVTPASERALERALHAALVIVVRHTQKSLSNAPRLSDFSSPSLSQVVNMFEERLLSAYPDESKYEYERRTIRKALDGAKAKWEKLSNRYTNLEYSASGKAPNVLLCDFHKQQGNAFPTMRSMRSVDVAIPMKF